MTIPSDSLPWVDLSRWFAGELSAREAESLAQWSAGDPERAATVAALRDAWVAAGRAGEGWDSAAALQRVYRTASDPAIIAQLGASNPAAISRWSAWVRPTLRMAAVLAALVGGALAVRYSGSEHGFSGTVPPGTTEYRTARGQQLTIRFTDGTQATLAPGSVLRRPADYGRRTRSLELIGEAYFIVTHDVARPFTVHTGQLVARDLGTRFVVRSYPEDGRTDVFVADGEVAVQVRDNTPAVLRANDIAHVDSAGHLVLRASVEPEVYLAWTEGLIVFIDTPLGEVKRQLERWYDVDVQLASPALTRLRVSGRFGRQPIAEELGTIAHALGLLVRRIDGRYELSRP